MLRRRRRPLTRFLLSLPLLLATVALAFAAGTYLGGHYLVPAGQGLAAPVEAMGYGLLAALIALVLATFATARMPMKILRLSALAGLAVCLLLAAGLTLAIRNAEADRNAEIRGLQPPRPSTEAVEPACLPPGGDTTEDGNSPCPTD